MIAIIDYGVGNLFSLESSFNEIGYDVKVVSEEKELQYADRIILPGVGAFDDAAKKLRQRGFFDAVQRHAENRRPLLGICLGMQLLFEKSFEYGEYDGLGLIPGNVRFIGEFIPQKLKIPHIGWNALEFTGRDDPLFKYVKNGDFVYFVHSFCAVGCEPYITAFTEYGTPVTASVRRENVFGCQFHPEKSGSVGLNILRAFCEME